MRLCPRKQRLLVTSSEFGRDWQEREEEATKVVKVTTFRKGMYASCIVESVSDLAKM